ncbi:hypothetical protein ACJEC8_00500 [Candidatus Carsonella ruddii]|uniref:hypothetical protein n=1 Tax=Carsonella ruddii TaxID=114186 RepID=UPI003D4D6773
MNYSILNLNFYLFKKKIFFNKIIYEKLNKKYFKYNIINYYNHIKKFLIYYNPFYGINSSTYFKKIKFNLKNNNKLKLENTFLLYKKFFKYKIPYKELTYIFNFSIEKIRIKKNV